MSEWEIEEGIDAAGLYPLGKANLKWIREKRAELVKLRSNSAALAAVLAILRRVKGDAAISRLKLMKAIDKARKNEDT